MLGSHRLKNKSCQLLNTVLLHDTFVCGVTNTTTTTREVGILRSGSVQKTPVSKERGSCASEPGAQEFYRCFLVFFLHKQCFSHFQDMDSFTEASMFCEGGLAQAEYP